MNIASTTRATLWIGAVYDLVLGVFVFFCFPLIFEKAGIIPANHVGYVQLPALFVIVLGIMQGITARRLEENRAMLVCIVLMKLSYVGVVFGHRLFGEMPGLWVVFGVCDLLFALIFLTYLAKGTPQAESSA